MSPRQIHFLLLTSAALVITSHQYLTALRLQHTPPPQTNPTSILKHCYILTLNASLKPRTLSPGLTCYPFLAERFNEQQFALVAPIAQQKLLYPEKQTMASDLTNNNSVSISVNHARMWKEVSKLSHPTLLLEDDAVVPSQNVHILHDIVTNLEHKNNYVVKVGETPHILGRFTSWATPLALTEWKLLFDIHGHKSYQCVCRPWFQTSNTAAYILSPTAAKHLLQHHSPMSDHVDVYVHKQGCIFQHIDFILINPAITFLSHRTSTHQHEESWFTRQKLLVRELIYNLKNDMCTKT